MEDWQRKEVLQALDAHFLGKVRKAIAEQVVPPMFPDTKVVENERLELCWSRLDHFPGSPRGMFLTASSRAKARNVLAAGFNLDSGQLLAVSIARGPRRIRIEYRDDGLLVRGTKHLEELARRELDSFLLNLCRSAAIDLPISLPLSESSPGTPSR